MRTMTEELGTVTADRDDPTALDLPASGSVETPAPVGRATRAPGRGRRAVGAVALAVGALVTGALLTRPPEAPAVARSPESSVATLPPMPASMGFWDRLQPPAPPLPEVPNDLGFWDRLRGGAGSAAGGRPGSPTDYSRLEGGTVGGFGSPPAPGPSQDPGGGDPRGRTDTPDELPVPETATP
jgi:hypothetical protein